MKRILIFFICYCFCYILYAQQLSVQKFNLVETDLTASSEKTKMIDQNGLVCALIKVKTPLQGFSFDVGSLGIIKTEQHKGEIWVYVPEGVKRITISHQQYGVLRDYDLGLTLKRGRTYHLLLKHKESSTKSSWAIDFSSNPSMADVYLDDKLIGKTPKQIQNLEPGVHQYRIVIPDYAEVAGQLNYIKGEPLKLFADLNKVKAPVVSVGNVSFNMVFVEGGTFMMGATNEQSVPEDNERPAHQVTLSSYYIAETEVTQQLWETVMGSNPSSAKGPNRPVNKVSWNDCQLFIEKLNKMTGLALRLPTEAEWEFAARGGNKSQGFQYSGSNDLTAVGWCRDNSAAKGSTDEYYNNVKSLAPNELGLYDMSGAMWEWCQDWMGVYSSSEQVNPIGVATGDERVIRGGSWKSSKWGCRVAIRNSESPDNYNNRIGMRLVVQSFPKDYFVYDEGEEEEQIEAAESVEYNTASFKVGDVAFSMVHVDGGTFYVWDGEGYKTEEMQQFMDAIYGNNYDLTLPSFYIGETEITQELWEAVMGANPVETLKRNKNLPVVNVTWNDCQKFLVKLNEITGKNFRLPTDAEWQFAAQGGKKSKGYKYSGSNNLSDVAWYFGNCASDLNVKPVKTKKPNELGIYDMSGNVWEWSSEKTFGIVDKTEPLFIIRGACVLNVEEECDLRFRGREHFLMKSNTLGFRIALSE